MYTNRTLYFNTQPLYDELVGLNSNVNSGNDNIDRIINTTNTVATSNTVLVSGVYNASLNTVSDGESSGIMVGEEGAIVCRTRCQSQALNDNISNTEDLPLSCNGDFVVYPCFQLMYDSNANKWVRLRGNTTDGLLCYDDTVNTSINNANTAIVNKLDNITLDDTNITSNLEVIDASINNLLTNTPKTLRQYREEGSCFIATCDLAGVAQNETAYLSNDTGTKKYLIHNITLSSQYFSTSTDRVSFTLYFGNSVYSSGGSAVQIASMNFSSIGSNVDVCGHGTSVVFSTANNYEVDHLTACAAGSSTVSRDYNEWIEVPTGNCVYLKSDTASTASDGKITFRWVEVDS